MDQQLWAMLGIDGNSEMSVILGALEEKQSEFYRMAETAADDGQKKELEDLINRIDSEIRFIKEQMQALDTAVVLDSDNESETEVSDPAERKAAELMAQRRQIFQSMSANSAARNAAADAPGDAAAPVGGTAPGGAAAPAPDHAPNHTNAGDAIAIPNFNNLDEEFNKALVEFKKQNYAAAFPVFKRMSEKGNTSAQYLLAIMYLDGLEVPSDVERAMFWFKKSASSKRADAQYAYGLLLMGHSNNEYRRVREAYKYLEKAAKQDYKAAKVKYVQATTLGLGGKKEINKSIQYCDALKAKETDSYNKQVYEETKKSLKKELKARNWAEMNDSEKKRKRKRRNILLIAVVLIIVAVIYCSKQYDKEKANQRKRPKANAATSGQASVTPEPTQVEQKPDDAAAERRIRVTSKNSNIRSGPSTDYDPIAKGDLGDEFVMTGNEQKASSGRLWYEIYLDADRTAVGWISETVVEVLE